MKKLRKLIEKYEKALMIVLIMVVLVIFTVTGAVVDFFRPAPEGAIKPDDRVGAFQILPGTRTEVSYAKYGDAQFRWRIWHALRTGGRGERVKDSEVWTYLVLREAARHEGVTVSNAELVTSLKRFFGEQLLADKETYRNFVWRTFGVQLPAFEEAIRDVLVTERLRDLYRYSFLIAPPAPREEMVEQYATQQVEYVRASWAAYPAQLELDAARAELTADADAEATLKDYFEKDPAVRADSIRFRHPRRYRFEMFYTMHRRMPDDAEYKRIKDLFFRVFPQLSPKLLEPDQAEELQNLREYYGNYKERLLEQAAERWVEAEKARLEERLKQQQEADPEGTAKTIEELRNDPQVQASLDEAGFDLVRDQVAREIKLRGMMWHLRDQAAKDPSRSLKDTFDLLVAQDDPDNPVCSTEPGKGLIVFRSYADQPLTGDELSDLTDGSERFTVNFRHRLTSIGTEDLPKLSPQAHTFGEQANGRVVVRLIEVEPERRKTFSELTEGEKAELIKDFYLPEKARERAKEKLEGLRKQLEAGEVPADGFEQAARALGSEGDSVRFIKDEWVTASYDFVAEPDRSSYWEADYLHMVDRKFLRRNLAGVLARDRVKKELGEGSWLEVQVDRRTDAENPGAAYLVLLHERRQPDADTMPPQELDSFVEFSRRGRFTEERQRWSDDFLNLIQTFRIEFFGDMQTRIEEQLKEDKKPRLPAQG